MRRIQLTFIINTYSLKCQFQNILSNIPRRRIVAQNRPLALHAALKKKNRFLSTRYPIEDLIYINWDTIIMYTFLWLKVTAELESKAAKSPMDNPCIKNQLVSFPRTRRSLYKMGGLFIIWKRIGTSLSRTKIQEHSSNTRQTSLLWNSWRVQYSSAPSHQSSAYWRRNQYWRQPTRFYGNPSSSTAWLYYWQISLEPCCSLKTWFRPLACCFQSWLEANRDHFARVLPLLLFLAGCYLACYLDV